MPIEGLPVFGTTTADDYASRIARIVSIYVSWLEEPGSLPALRSVTFEVQLVHDPTYWYGGARRRHQSAWYRMAKHLASRPLKRVSIVMFMFKEDENTANRTEMRNFFALPMAPLQSKGILDVRFDRKLTFEESFF